MRTQILAADDVRWVDILNGMPHDFYSLPGYVRLAARSEGGTPIAVVAEDGDRCLLLPLLVRDIVTEPDDPLSAGWRDAASPYGYPGIGLSTTDPADLSSATFLDAALAEIMVLLRTHRIASLFIRLNPLLPVDTLTLSRYGVVVDHGYTVSIDLIRDDADQMMDVRRGHAKNLRRLDRLGFTCEIDRTCCPASVSAFVDVYTETMDRLGASPSYYFDTDYVTDLITALDGRVMIALTRSGIDRDLAAAGLYTEVNGIVQAHLGGTRSAYMSVAPSKLETRETMRWARGRGNRFLHLGGGLGGREDALFQFKAGFSPRRHLFQTARFILDQPVYDDLTAGWEARAGQSAGDLTGFFPAYRAPLPAPVTISQGTLTRR